MVHRSRGTDAVYRCPKGGFHRFKKKPSLLRVFIGFSLGSERVVRVRRCVKCGTTYGAGGQIRKG